jgi:putative SOS response-associated peptidase YedK
MEHRNLSNFHPISISIKTRKSHESLVYFNGFFEAETQKAMHVDLTDEPLFLFTGWLR